MALATDYKPLFFMKDGMKCKTYVKLKEKVDTMHLMTMIMKDELPEGKVCFVKCYDANKKMFTLHVDPAHAREFYKQLEDM